MDAEKKTSGEYRAKYKTALEIYKLSKEICKRVDKPIKIICNGEKL